jgi:hypothetical protein
VVPHWAYGWFLKKSPKIISGSGRGGLSTIIGRVDCGLSFGVVHSVLAPRERPQKPPRTSKVTRPDFPAFFVLGRRASFLVPIDRASWPGSRRVYGIVLGQELAELLMFEKSTLLLRMRTTGMTGNIGSIFVKKSIISQIRGPNGPGIYQHTQRGQSKAAHIATPRSAHFFTFQSCRKNAVAFLCSLYGRNLEFLFPAFTEGGAPRPF